MTMAMRRMLAGSAMAVVAASLPVQAQAQAQTYRFNIKAQSLDGALRAFARTTRLPVLFDGALVRGKRTAGVNGTMSADEALTVLLRGSGLQVSRGSQGAYVVKAGQQTDGAVLPVGEAEAGSAPADSESAELLVTGSRIRGAPATSPVTTISRREAERSGQSDLGQLIRDLPQNFSGGTNPTIAGPGQGGTQNANGSSALNLRGLGPDASLTLINGHRIAFDATSQGVDISAIPLAAIERVEVAADGASALYGSDAVGGVANVILRRRVDDVVTSARLGAATDGGAVTQQYTIVGGPAWGTGSFMVAADYRDQSELAGRHRSYTGKLAPDATMIAGMEQFSLVMAGEQAITDTLKFQVDGNYLHRSVAQCLTSTAVAPGSCYDNGAVPSAKVDSWSVAPSLKLNLSSGWEVRLSAGYSESDTTIVTSSRSGGVETVRALPKYDNRLKTAELGAEGPLFTLPGGTARVAFGAGYRSNQLHHDLSRFSGGVTTPVLVFDQKRDVTFGYGELFLPLVAPGNSVALVNKLQVVGALRYEDHHGVERVATPKIGLVYSPFDGIEFKANWGKSFKAPTLYQQGQASMAQLVSSTVYAPAPPTNQPVLFLFGGNPNLTPERATTWNVSATISPPSIEGLRAEVGYFHIRYRDRVATPVANGTTAFLPIYSDLVTLNPSAQEVLAALDGITGVFTNLTSAPFDPANVSAIFRNYLQNVALQLVEGVDASVSYSRDFGSGGILSIKGAATYIDSSRKVTATLPLVPQAGVVFTPPHWRGRLNANWERGNLGITVIGNYVGGTRDNRFNPVTRIASFTTFDTVVTVRTGDDDGLLSNIEWKVGLQNLLNKKPAIIRTSNAALPPYDSLNQSPLGRVINLTLTKAW